MKISPSIRLFFLIIVFLIQFLLLISYINSYYSLQNSLARTQKKLTQANQERDSFYSNNNRDMDEKLERSEDVETLERIDPSQTLSPDELDLFRSD